LDRSFILPGTSIYFYTKLGKKTSWEPGFVSQALPEYVGVRRQLGSRGAILKIAYEDIRLAPSSSLLQELDALAHNCDASKDSDMEEPSPKQTFSSFLTSMESAPIDAPDESVASRKSPRERDMRIPVRDYMTEGRMTIRGGGACTSIEGTRAPSTRDAIERNRDSERLPWEKSSLSQNRVALYCTSQALRSTPAA
jgi:hypothetical protein